MSYQIKHISSIKPIRQENGLALVFVLIMMTVVFSIVAVTSRIATQGERAMRNDRDRQIAFNAAEAAIDDALQDITADTDSRREKFATMYPREVGECSGDEDERGICGIDQDASINPYPLFATKNSVDWNETGSTRKYVTYGDHTNRSGKFGAGTGSISAQAPKYIVQKYPARFTNRPELAAQQNGEEKVRTFLVTALGYGANPETRVFLQAVIFQP